MKRIRDLMSSMPWGWIVGLGMAPVVLGGCGPTTAPDGNAVGIGGYNQPVYLYEDKMTGCQYVAADSVHSAITPRIAADGKTHMGCKAVKP